MVKDWMSLTTEDFSDLKGRDPLGILLVGSIEQHGPHLPVATDSMIGEGLLERSFEHVPTENCIIKLPSLFVGSSPEHGDFPGTISYPPEILVSMVVEIGRQVKTCGIRRLLVVNSHGGNSASLDIASMKLRSEFQLLVVKVDYFRLARPKQIDFPDCEWSYGLHGGALETSMMLTLEPDLVKMGDLKNNTSWMEELAVKHRRLGKDRAVSLYWMASDLNESGAVGDATLASSEKGKVLVEYYSRCLSEVMMDVGEMDLTRLVDE